MTTSSRHSRIRTRVIRNWIKSGLVRNASEVAVDAGSELESIT
jgi:hypothetical protein